MTDVKRPITTQIVTQCPVCFTILGKRDPATLYKAHCKECRTTFMWYPGKNKPTGTLDKSKPQRCGCNRCDGQ